MCMNDMEKFLTETGKGAAGLAKDQILDFFHWGAEEGDAFTQKQKAKLNKYMMQLVDREISPKEFKENIEDIFNTLAEMERLKMTVAQKAAVQRIVEGIQDLIVGNLLKFL